MICKDGLAANGEPPIPKISEEGIWIAKTAECKKRASAYFIGGDRSDLAAKAAEPDEPSRSREHRILSELPDRVDRSRSRFSARKNNQICAAHCGYRFAKTAGRQQGISNNRPGNH